MSLISKKNALELQRIIKEATGREIALGEAFAIWGYLLKLLKLLWNVEDKKRALSDSQQANLFDSKTKVSVELPAAPLSRSTQGLRMHRRGRRVSRRRSERSAE